MDKLLHIIFSIRNSESVETAKRDIIASFKRLGFDGIGISVNKATEADYAENPDIISFGDDYAHEYKTAGMRRFDFNLKRARSYREPFWFAADRQSLNPDDRRFSEFLLSHGISQGLALLSPSNNGLMSGFLLSMGQRLRCSHKLLMDATIIANTAMMKLEMLGSCKHLSSDQATHLRQLSPIQFDILHWSAEGKSNADIALILGLSKGGVDYHIRAIVKKIGVSTKAQAIAVFSRKY